MEELNNLQKEEIETIEAIALNSVKKRKPILFVIIGIILVTIIVLIIDVIVMGSDERKVREQLNLGAKYLEELNYEQAILQYKLVLETDIQNKEALTKISEAYGLMAEEQSEYTERMEAYDMAIEYALSACEYYPEDTTLQDMLVSTYMNAGDYCLENENLDDAEMYYTDGKEWAEKFSMTDKSSQIDEKLAEIEQKKKEFAQAEAEQLGAKYLEEMEYEKALDAFKRALEINPMSVEAYLGIVEVYIRTNEFEMALEYARKGYDLTGDERLKEKIDMIESGNIFASNGWTMKESNYDGDGRLMYWHEFAYNMNGKKTSVTVYDAQGNQKQYLELLYDEEGRDLINYDGWSSESGLLTKSQMEYGENYYRKTLYEGISDVVTGYYEVNTDADGRSLREEYYDANLGFTFATEYEYDLNGKLIRWNTYDWNNNLLSYSVFTYDNDGKSLQQQGYDAEGNLEWYNEDVYDDEGNLIKWRQYDANGNLEYETIYE